MEYSVVKGNHYNYVGFVAHVNFQLGVSIGFI
jgi:hypothetical protein